MKVNGPITLTRYIDKDGKKKLIIISQSKAIGKFIVEKEFDPNTFEPNWKEIEFKP